MPKLSIIILNYNTKDLILDCLLSLKKTTEEADFEVIVSDNGSTDGSVEEIKKHKFNFLLHVIENGRNLGFAKGNNAARKIARGKYILFLNSDTVVPQGTIKGSLDYLDVYNDVGALTCKTVLPSGKLDRDARRSFPTPWVAFTHFVYLDRLFPTSRLFAKYWYGYLPTTETHEVDVLQGAFFLARKEVLDEVGWFDEDYFLDGEDIDLCWRIKEKGHKIIYYPKVYIIHVKGASKGKNKNLKQKPPLKDRLNFALAGVNSMEIFYGKRLSKKYPIYLTALVLAGIRLIKAIRTVKVLLS